MPDCATHARVTAGLSRSLARVGDGSSAAPRQNALLLVVIMTIHQGNHTSFQYSHGVTIDWPTLLIGIMIGLILGALVYGWHK